MQTKKRAKPGLSGKAVEPKVTTVRISPVYWGELKARAAKAQKSISALLTEILHEKFEW